MQRIIVDVREPAEYATGHVNGAINVPPTVLINGAGELANTPKDAEIILYCNTGSRSNVAKNILTSMGYTNVVNGINKDHINNKLGGKNG